MSHLSPARDSLESRTSKLSRLSAPGMKTPSEFEEAMNQVFASKPSSTTSKKDTLILGSSDRLVQLSMHSVASDKRLSVFMFGSPTDRRQSTVTPKKGIYSNYEIYKFQFKRPMQKFLTGSRYIGPWNVLGFTGSGLYRYPHGVLYDGEFNTNGEFHGPGTLIYPNGQQVQGVWRDGRLGDKITFIFASGEVFDDNCQYCVYPDRRFNIEIKNGFGPANQEYQTNDPEARPIPLNNYDVVEGIYDPKTHAIFANPPSRKPQNFETFSNMYPPLPEHKIKEYVEINQNAEEESMKILGFNEFQKFTIKGKIIKEIPNNAKSKWIEECCRKGADDPVGFKPEYYVPWMAGRRNETYYCDDSKAVKNVSLSDFKDDSDKIKIISFIRTPGLEFRNRSNRNASYF